MISRDKSGRTLR